LFIFVDIGGIVDHPLFTLSFHINNLIIQ